MKSIPSSVYRIQLSTEFPLKSAIALLPYLAALGIEGLYCSPIFLSYSSGGYDVLDPNKLNPELGTMDEWDALCRDLQERKMALIVDVIPNHMSTKSKQNQWWYDVLKRGMHSRFANYFDINWHSEKIGLEYKVLLPILEALYGYCLDHRLIKLEFRDDFCITYGEFELPLSEESLLQMRSRGDNIEELLTIFNAKESLHMLLEMQFYRLAYWKVAGQEINYRRFFNVNELAAIRIEEEQVLQDHHRWVFHMLDTKQVQGLRIDHPDGLYDPTEYFKRLKKHDPELLIVEKILDFEESLPEQWCVDGTVGYNFMAIVNGLFVQGKNKEKFTEIYSSFTGEKLDLKRLIYERKKVFVHKDMSSEVHRLGAFLSQIAENNKYFRDFTETELTLAVKEIISCMSVYRTYLSAHEPLNKRDSQVIQDAVEMAKNKTPELDESLYTFIQNLFLQAPYTEQVMDFIQRFQQITGPVMAKSMEDSVFYIYNRLLSLNEVGSHPQDFGFSKAQFHQFNKVQHKKWPYSFLSASTHDTKRSHDMRMRLNVLSEMPEEWQEIVQEWAAHSESAKTVVQDALYPDKNTEYYIYQQYLGLYSDEDEFPVRFWRSILKGIREAGVYTSWYVQSGEYENAVKKFVETLPSLPRFAAFHQKISSLGVWNSLSSMVLLVGSCGIVDLYQGNEWFCFQAEDPDNRTALDLEKCFATIDFLNVPHTLSFEKQRVLSALLHFRRENKELFLQGEYFPLKIQGPLGENVVAYARSYKERIIVFAGARFFYGLTKGEIAPVGQKCWGAGSYLELEKKLVWQELFTNTEYSGDTIALHALFEHLPVAVLVGEVNKKG